MTRLCPRGLHDLNNPHNVYVYPSDGTSTCRPCKRARTRWDTMIRRCTDPKNHKYADYGGRGITVAPEWLDFEYYYRDVGDPPEPGLSLDRIDNNGNYEPGNVRWATPVVQRANRRRRPEITHCPKGHPYAGDNLYIYPNGKARSCRACKRQAWRDRDERKAKKAAEVARIKAEALREAAADWSDDPEDADEYEIHVWLRERADAIEEDAGASWQGVKTA